MQKTVERSVSILVTFGLANNSKFVLLTPHLCGLISGNLPEGRIVVEVNHTLRLNCSLAQGDQGGDAANINWARNGQDIPNALINTLDLATSQLVIERPQFGDSGVYGCHVNNSFTLSTFNVTVGRECAPV